MKRNLTSRKGTKSLNQVNETMKKPSTPKKKSKAKNKPKTKSKTKEVALVTVNKKDILPDNAQWTNRFEIKSESSNRLYVIAQHKAKKHWGCSCPSWRIRRTCKHLNALNLPAFEKPMEVKMIKR